MVNPTFQIKILWLFPNLKSISLVPEFCYFCLKLSFITPSRIIWIIFFKWYKIEIFFYYINKVNYRYINNTFGSYLRSFETPKRERGYLCNTALEQCMMDCRNEAGRYFEDENIIESNATTSSLNIFGAPKHNTVAAISVCVQMASSFQIVNIWMVNVFLKYNSGQNQFPFTEELFLGTICCERLRPTLTVPFDCDEFARKNPAEKIIL